MNWLDPGEVREWLAQEQPHPADFKQRGQTVRAYGNALEKWEDRIDVAWAEFGRAVAALDLHTLVSTGKAVEIREVARIIRDAEEGK